MEILWNDTKLKPPPVNTYKNSGDTLDVLQLQTILNDAIFFMENQQCLHREAAIISRLIYLMGRKFRHDIGHSYVRRTNIALLKYLNLEFLTDLKTFLSVVPTNASPFVYFPTRQMLEYILVRFQTFAKIVFRIVICAKKAATFYFERIKRGDSAWLSLMPYTVLSRVWFLSNRLVKNACKWYNKLLPFRNCFKLVGVPFLPSDYILPHNLIDWLGFEAYENESSFLWKSGAHNVLSSSIHSEKTDILDKSVLIDVENSEENKQNELAITNDRTRMKNIDDVGIHSKIYNSSKINNGTDNAVFLQQVQKDSLHVDDIGEKISRKDFVKLQRSSINTKKSSTLSFPMKKFKESKPIVLNSTVISDNNKHELKNILTSNNKSIEIEKISSKRTNNLKSIHSIDSVKCSKSLLKFLQKEETLRLANNSLSLTKDMSFMQWQSVKKVLLKLQKKLVCTSNQRSEKILVILKNFWTERCTC